MRRTAYRSETGRVRDRDEDSIIVLRSSSVYQSEEYDRTLLILADGVGGSPSGEIASYLAAKMLAEYLLPELSSSMRGRDYLSSLKTGIKETNRRVIEYAARNPQHEGMCTTLVAAVLEDERLYVGNVGDSRLYLIDKEGIRQVTEDQVGMGGMLLQAVGYLPEVEPDTFRVVLQAGDRVLMCCDGLTDAVSDEEIKEGVLKSKNLREACSTLVDLANERGGVDNISLILVGEKDECT